MVYKYFAQFENSSWEHQAKPSKLSLHRTWVEQSELKERTRGEFIFVCTSLPHLPIRCYCTGGREFNLSNLEKDGCKKQHRAVHENENVHIRAGLEKSKEGKGLQGWCTGRGAFPPGWVMLTKCSYCPCLKAQLWLPVGSAVLHCHGLRNRGNETEAFVNSKHFCFSMICLCFLSDFKWSNHKSLQKEGNYPIR